MTVNLKMMTVEMKVIRITTKLIQVNLTETEIEAENLDELIDL